MTVVATSAVMPAGWATAAIVSVPTAHVIDATRLLAMGIAAIARPRAAMPAAPAAVK